MRILSFLKSLISRVIRQHSSFRIEEIDVDKLTVMIRCRGSREVIKTSFEAVIKDLDILERLSPTQACILGGYYGRHLKNSNRNQAVGKAVRNMPFQLVDKRGLYKLATQDFTTGNITYFNKKTRQSFSEHPLTVVQNEHIISEFDPSEACYIGMLAGMAMEKAIIRDAKLGTHQLESLLNKKPTLRVVE